MLSTGLAILFCHVIVATYVRNYYSCFRGRILLGVLCLDFILSFEIVMGVALVDRHNGRSWARIDLILVCFAPFILFIFWNFII